MARRSLGRDRFRDGVFARDRHRCVVCSAPAVDAHHLLERRLFADGGYELDNGVSLCGPHHLEAEATTISCEALREAAAIGRVVLPPQLHPGRGYDKWGNPIRGDGRRLRGELFFEEPVQRILAPMIRSFIARAEAPRTAHLPWSPGRGDFVLAEADVDALAREELVVVRDLPGEIVAIDAEGAYIGAAAPLVDPPAGLAELPARIVEWLPTGGRICGVIDGDALRVTAAWDDRDTCLAWDEVALLAEALELPIAATLRRGSLEIAALRERAPELGPHVVRPAGPFAAAARRRQVACWRPV